MEYKKDKYSTQLLNDKILDNNFWFQLVKSKKKKQTIETIINVI